MKNDYRNFLFESYLKVVKHFKPKAVVFENVPGLLSAKPGDVPIVELIQQQFLKAGYAIIQNLRNAIIDVSDYGIPQKRKRVIILGLRKDFFKDKCTSLLEQFYKEILPSFKQEKKKTLRDAIGDLSCLYPANKVMFFNGRKTAHTIPQMKIKNHISRYHNQRDIELFSILAADIESGINQYLPIESRKALYTQYTGKIGDAQLNISFFYTCLIKLLASLVVSFKNFISLSSAT